MKTLNGYEVVDAKARQDIANIHIPSKVSELDNDKGYLTEHQSLEGLATEVFVDEQIAAIPEPDLSHKADKVHTHKLNEIVDYQSPDLSGYTTKEYVDAADKKHTQDIANLTHHIQNIIEPTIMQKTDKGHKHTLSEITDYKAPVIPTKVSQLANDAGYLTQHQDISGKANKVHIHTLSEITDYAAPDLSNYAKRSEIPDVSKFLTAVPKEYITETELEAKGYLTEHQSLSNYYTKAQTDSAIGEAVSGIKIPEVDVSGKADLVHKHSMADITDYVAPVIPSLDGYATEQYVDDAIANLDIPEADVDLSNYYTKSEVDTKIEQAVIGDVDLTSYCTKSQAQEWYTANYTSIKYLETRIEALENIAIAEEGSY